MSPRRHPRTRTAAHQVRPVLGAEATQTRAGGDWVIRAVPGQTATKTYRCPGCDQHVPPGTAHIVAWPTGDRDSRRHWHSPCWRRHPRR